MPAFREGKVARVGQWLAAQRRRLERLRADQRLQRFASTTCRCSSGPPIRSRPIRRPRSPRSPAARLAHPEAVRMIKKFIDQAARQVAGDDERRAALRQARRGAEVAQHGIDPTLVDERAVKVVSDARRRRLRGLHRRRRGARPAGGPAPEGLRRRHQRHARTGQGAVPPRLHHRPALSHRARGVRPRPPGRAIGSDRGLDLPRDARRRRRRRRSPATRRPRASELAGKSHVVDAEGRVLRDNVWGPQIEDAARRDFTVNAMYYDPVTRDRGRLPRRHQGREEEAAAHDRRPGRRATAKTRCASSAWCASRPSSASRSRPKTRAPISEMAALLDNVPAVAHLRRDDQAAADRPRAGLHRRAEEATACIAACSRCSTSCSTRRSATTGAREVRQPRAGRHRPRASPKASRWRRASCSPAMLWHDVPDGWQTAARTPASRRSRRCRQAIDAVFDARIGDISGRGKLAADMREIWMMQPRFERRTGSSALALLEQPRFRAGFDFLRLRADVGEVEPALRGVVGGALRGERRASAATCSTASASSAARAASSAPRRARAAKRGGDAGRAAARSRRGGRERRARRRRRSGRATARRRASAGAGGGSPQRAGRLAVVSAMAEPDAADAGRDAFVGPRLEPRRPRRRDRPRARRARRAAGDDAASRGRRSTDRRRSTRRGDDYLNAVAQLRTSLAPLALLRRVAGDRASRRARAAVRAMRRARSTSTCCSTATRCSRRATLTLPHPRLHERAFVLAAAGRDRAGGRRPWPWAGRRPARGVAGQRVVKLDR